MYSLGHLALEQGERERAARLLGAFTALREATGSATRRSILVRDDVAVVESLRSTLGEAAFEAAWAAGRGMGADPKGLGVILIR